MAEEIKDTLVGKKIKAVPKDPIEIGIDTDNTLTDNMIDAVQNDVLDLSALQAFTNVSQTRENVYKLIDTMSQDSTIASILETYAEDCCETNDKGQVVWVESADANVGKFVEYLLGSMNVDKHTYGWIYSLIKYGDLYLKLFKTSDYDEDILFDTEENKDNKLNESVNDDDFKLISETIEELQKAQEKTKLEEDVNLKVSSKNDHYVHYIEAVPNPGEMFELTKFGKTKGYIKAPAMIQNVTDTGNTYNPLLKYQMNKKDVDVYQATSFVHACLEDNSSRTPEEVNIFVNTSEEDEKVGKDLSYTVKRGQSLLYNSFKIWRELSLLENSILLNRITKSSIIRTIQIECGDMGKEQVGAYLQQIKSLIEQKSAINTAKSYSEYTNPGPVENNIYVPTHEGKGAITTSQIGGDVDVKSLTDLDYFRDKFFAAMRVPKQFFGFTDDSTGFNGGTSLTIISSRYGKAIKRIQNTYCQALTDVVNLMLLDKGLDSYVNSFTIRMQTPVTQEEIDRKDNLSNRIRIVGDIMNTLTDVEDKNIKLKIIKSLLASAVPDTELIDLIQEQIDLIDEGNEKSDNETVPTFGGGSNDVSLEEPSDEELDNMETEEEVEEAPKLEEPNELPTPAEAGANEEGGYGESFDTENDNKEILTEDNVVEQEDDYLPNGEELGIDLTQNK